MTAPKKIYAWANYDFRKWYAGGCSTEPLMDGTENHEYTLSDLVPQWKTIDTAPRDRVVLGYQADWWGEEIIEPMVYVEGVIWEEANGEMYTRYQPTHWMPLPKPPKDS